MQYYNLDTIIVTSSAGVKNMKDIRYEACKKVRKAIEVRHDARRNANT